MRSKHRIGKYRCTLAQAPCRGMSEIRIAMAHSLTPIHDNAFTAAQYEALATRIQTQIDYVAGNCKLPEQADERLHLVLEQIIDGAAGMTTGADRNQGAIKIVRARSIWRVF